MPVDPAPPPGAQAWDIDQLNGRFALGEELRFHRGAGGLPMAEIHNDHASATISLYAGHVLSYLPAGQAHDLLYLSDQASYQPGKAIRGGIPVCWPWFGPDPEGQGRPAHGLARTRPWQLLACARGDDGATRLSLGLHDDSDTRALWPHAFALSLDIVVGAGLILELVTRNLGTTPFTLSQALHSYFAVGDIDRTAVHGLDGCDYLDKLTGGHAIQSGALRVAGEVDRIYRRPPAALVIEDAAWSRRIHIASTGSRSAVVWNPWAATAANMADLGNEDYRRMLCVETANAGDDVVTVPAGGAHRLEARYRIETGG